MLCGAFRAFHAGVASSKQATESDGVSPGSPVGLHSDLTRGHQLWVPSGSIRWRLLGGGAWRKDPLEVTGASQGCISISKRSAVYWEHPAGREASGRLRPIILNVMTLH